MANIADVISQVIERYGQPYTQDLLDELVARVEQAQPNNPATYAHRTAMNWCIDQQRHIIVLKRAQEREHKRQEQEVLHGRWQTFFIKAHEQFWPTATKMMQQMTDKQKETANQNLLLLYLHVFLNMSDAELVPLFPNTRRDARYQRRHRIKNALLPHTPDELAHVLSQVASRERRPWMASH